MVQTLCAFIFFSVRSSKVLSTTRLLPEVNDWRFVSIIQASRAVQLIQVFYYSTIIITISPWVRNRHDFCSSEINRPLLRLLLILILIIQRVQLCLTLSLCCVRWIILLTKRLIRLNVLLLFVQPNRPFSISVCTWLLVSREKH